MNSPRASGVSDAQLPLPSNPSTTIRMDGGQTLSAWRAATSWGLIVAISVPIFITLGACNASGQSSNAASGIEEGMASYYGANFAGQTTASGERFDPGEYTAAHPSLPFGTVVRVVRLGTTGDRSVRVRINDRGPFADDRIIDVSKAAAEELGMIDDGVVRVRLEIVERPEEESNGSRASGNGW